MTAEMDNLIRMTGSVLVTETQALGRDDEAPLDEYPLAQFDAFLDPLTCGLCARLDGQTFRRDSPEYKRYSPPVHINDRCVWVYIHRDEAGDHPIYDPAKDPGLADLVDRHGHFVREPQKFEPLRVPAEPAGRNFIVRKEQDPHTGEWMTVLDWQSWPQIVQKAAKEAEVAAGRIALAGRRAIGPQAASLPEAGDTPGAQAALEQAYRDFVPPDVQKAGDELVDTGVSTGYNVFDLADDPRAEGQLRYAMYLSHQEHGAQMVEAICRELGEVPPYTVKVRAGSVIWGDWGDEDPVWFRGKWGSSVDYQLVFRPRHDAQAQELAQVLARFGTEGKKEALPQSWAIPNARMAGALPDYVPVILNVKRVGNRWLATLTRQALAGWDSLGIRVNTELARFIY